VRHPPEEILFQSPHTHCSAHMYRTMAAARKSGTPEVKKIFLLRRKEE
jgi:hypothetical protein